MFVLCKNVTISKATQGTRFQCNKVMMWLASEHQGLSTISAGSHLEPSRIMMRYLQPITEVTTTGQ